MRLLSPRQLAEAIGSSESSLKRWSDEGLINVTRTAGGHRRIELSEAVRFIREANMPVVRPEVLGIAELAEHEPAMDNRDASDQFRSLLKEGNAPAARSLVLSLFMSGWSVSRICDGPVRDALQDIGRLWENDPAGVCTEHRATDICIQAINQLRTLLPENEGGPLAMGGAFPGDPYALPSLCAAATLTSCGFRAVNFGPNVPFDSLLPAVDVRRPRLVWLSLSHTPTSHDLARRLHDFASTLRKSGINLTVGGRIIDTLSLPPEPGFHVGHTMSELASFAEGIRSAST